MKFVSKLMGWICVTIWIGLMVGDIICAVKGAPIPYDWIDIILRDAIIASVSIGGLAREYF